MKLILNFLFAASTFSPLCAGELLFPNSDFEAGSLMNWTAEGSAFTRQPTKGDNTSARGNLPSLHEGDYWLGTFENYDGETGEPGNTRGDNATGSLTSQEFTISKPYITFLVGGGNRPEEASVKLVCEGEEYEMATGSNAESMLPVTFDASDLMGREARIVVTDQATGGWGHLNVDHFEGSNEPAELGGRHGAVDDRQALAVQGAGQLALHPVGGLLGVAAGIHYGLEVFGHLAAGREHTGVVGRKSQIVLEAGALFGG
jgi:hypothetical protein